MLPIPTAAISYLLRQAALLLCGYAVAHNWIPSDQLGPTAQAVADVVLWGVPAAGLVLYGWRQRVRLKRATIADVAAMHANTTTIHTDPATAAAVNLPNVIATPPAQP